jgi:hypothetical protein
MSTIGALQAGLPSGMTSRHSSESAEHYTPEDIVESARISLGSIDLDPASCEEANRVIQASTYFTREDNGYRREWVGRVFLNPPGGLSDNLERVVKPKCRELGTCGLPGTDDGGDGHKHEGVESNQKKWWFKLSREWWAGRTSSAVFVMFSIELLQNTQSDTPVVGDSGTLPIPLDFAICIPRTRLKYRKPGGKIGDQPPHASGIVLVSDNKETTRKFSTEFSRYGRVIFGPTALRTLG